MKYAIIAIIYSMCFYLALWICCIYIDFTNWYFEVKDENDEYNEVVAEGLFVKTIVLTIQYMLVFGILNIKLIKPQSTNFIAPCLWTGFTFQLISLSVCFFSFPSAIELKKIYFYIISIAWVIIMSFVLILREHCEQFLINGTQQQTTDESQERWLEYFPLSQLLFVSGERLIADSVIEITRVQDFLGLKRVISEKHFYFNTTKGFPCLMKSEQKAVPHCLGKTKGRSHPYIDPTAIQRLRDFYRPFNQRFYQLTRMNFGWS